MKTAVQFGAGNIGRGFMGQLLWEAGYRTIFVEYDRTLVDRLNQAGAYPLRLLDAYSKKELDMTINNFEALSTEETDAAAEAFSKAEVVGTAVGVGSLEAIAPLVAAGIKMRKSGGYGPLDIYLCENMYGAGEKLKEFVIPHLTDDEARWAEDNIGFVATSVARMVPAPDKRFEKEGPLFVVADSYHKLPYDKPAQRAAEPPIEGLKPVANFKAEVERKLYTHNLGHAAMGYIGYLKGYTYVDEPFQDDFLRPIFDGALEETARALVKMYPQDIDPEEHRAIRQDVNIRFGNPMLRDALTRVARDPIRKLGAQDRLIGSAKLCLDYEVVPENIAYVCGAAYCYDYPEDPKAVELQDHIQKNGIGSALQEVSQISPDSLLGKKILDAYKDLQEKRKAWK
jgi:mannitol-1-phosphate 5-dehydrogenase